jgi:hypothetical protein
MLSNKYSEPTPSNLPQNNKTTQIIIIGGILLLLLVLLNIVIYLRGGEKVKEAKAETVEKTAALDDLKKQRDAAFNSLDSLKALFPARELEIEQLKQKVEEQAAIIRRGINGGGARLAEARKQIDELNKANATLTEQLRERDGKIAQLQSDNDRLMEEIKAISNDLNTARIRIETLERTAAEGGDKNQSSQETQSNPTASPKRNLGDNAAPLSVSGVFLNPKEVSKKDKSGQTDRDSKYASKTSRFQISFTVDPTDGVPNGTQKFHIQLIDPSQTTVGSLIGKDRSSGQEYKYTLEKELNYTGSSEQVLVRFDYPGKVEKGDYSVNIWHNGIKVGTGACQLKK